ncbi:MAG: YbdD/YjiX family protein [Methylotenera sp.]
MLKSIKNFWQSIRQLSGDDAYERYLKHYSEHYAGNEQSENMPPLLSREEFFKQWQDGKWKGVKRCC